MHCRCPPVVEGTEVVGSVAGHALRAHVAAQAQLQGDVGAAGDRVRRRLIHSCELTLLRFSSNRSSSVCKRHGRGWRHLHYFCKPTPQLAGWQAAAWLLTNR